MKVPHLLLLPTFVLHLVWFTPSAVGAASAQSQSPSESGRYGGTAVLAGGGVFDLNPITRTGAVEVQFIENVVFLPVLRWNEDLEPAPGLVRSWSLNADSTLLTFILRDDLYWHDGVRTTAADLKFTYDRYLEAQPTLRDFFGEAEVLDDFTFRVRMRPHADYLATWTRLAAIPQHVWKDIPFAEMRAHSLASQSVVGNGPFMVETRLSEDDWIFRANDRFPAEVGGRPYLDRIRLRPFAQGADRVAELVAGDVDYMIPTPAEEPAIATAPDVQLISFARPNVTSVVWNMTRPLVRDPEVRRAITMAIDRQAIVAEVLRGRGRTANSPVTPAEWSYDPAAGANLRYDAAAASRLLAAAGWQDRNGNGVLEDAEGREFRLDLVSTSAASRTVELISANLRAVGVAVDPRLVPAAGDVARDPAGNFDGVLLTFVGSLIPNYTNAYHCRGSRNYSRMCDPAMDRVLEALPLLMSRESAIPLWSQFQHRLVDLQPELFLYHQDETRAIKRRLRDVNLDVRGALVNITRWWIAPEDQ